MRILVMMMISIFVMSCGQKPEFTRQELIGRRLKAKLDNYRDNLLEKCYEKTLSDARIYVDSMVSAELSFADPINYPDRPSKPHKPKAKNKQEDTEAKPIFDRNK